MKNPRIRRWLYVAGVSLLALMLLVAVVFIATSGGAPKPLPNPNGYDDLLKAAQAMDKKYTTESSLEELRALVSSNSESLQLLRVGLARPCRVPTDAMIAKIASANTDLGRLKSLAHLLVAEGKLASLENRPADAARSYLDAIYLGNQVSHGGLLVNRLVGTACEAIGGSPLVKLAPQLTPEQLRPLIPRLETIIENSADWADIIDNEKRFARFALRNNPSEWLHPVKLVSDLIHVRRGLKMSQERHDMAAAHMRLLLAEMALRCYQADSSKPAENLQALVPKYLKQVPLDPFSNQPLVYHIAKTNWTLYSVGPDCKDDGGMPLGKVAATSGIIGQGKNSNATQTIGDLFFDSAWK